MRLSLPATNFSQAVSGVDVMKFHFGGMPRGQLRFDIGSVSSGKGADRMTFRRWLVHHVGRRSWGVSFGHKLFIGVLHFDGTFEEQERIK